MNSYSILPTSEHRGKLCLANNNRLEINKFTREGYLNTANLQISVALLMTYFLTLSK